MPASVKGRNELADHGAVFPSDSGNGDESTETTLLQIYELRRIGSFRRFTSGKRTHCGDSISLETSIMQSVLDESSVRPRRLGQFIEMLDYIIVL